MTEKLEIKAAFSVDDTGAIEGVAWPFGSADTAGDVITKGAFTAPATLPMLFGHDQMQPIGVWDSITETDNGLTVKGRLVDDVARAREVRALVKANALTGLSIGFRTKAAKPRPGRGRTITALDLAEVSIVAVPAHPGATITSIKSQDGSTSHNAAKERTVENEELETVETKEAPALDTKALDALTARLDKLEAKANRPQIAAPAIVTPDADLETKAFIEYARKGVERMEAKAASTLTVGTDASGGYLAPEAFGAEVLKKIVEWSPIRQYARVVNIGASAVKYPRKLTGSTATWTGETAARSQSDMTFEQATFTPYELSTYVNVSTQLLEDNAYNLEGELIADFAEAFGKAEGTAFVTGDGSERPTGLLSATGITETKTGAASTLGTDPAKTLIGLFHAVPSIVAQNGVWIMNRTTLGTLRTLKDDSGRFIMLDPITAGAPTTLLGRPIVEATDMPDVAAGKSPIVFGDLSGYRIVDRVGLSVLRDPYTLATKGQVQFVAHRRVGADVSHPDRFIKLTVGTVA